MQLATVPDIRKIFSFEVIMTFFGKFLGKYRHDPQIFKSRFRNSSLDSRIYWSRSPSFDQVSELKSRLYLWSAPMT